MIRFLLGAIVWLILLLILFLPLAILVVLKLVVTTARHVLPIPRGSSVRSYSSLSPGDCMVAWDSSTKKPIMNFGFLLVLQGKVSVTQFREHFAATFITNDADDRGRYDKFFSYLVTFGGYPFRATNSSISIEDHILERKLGNETLQECLVNWLHSGNTEGRPCWEMLVIPLEHEGVEETGIAFKIHHAFADGYSILHILDKLTSNTSPYLVKDFTTGFATHVRQIVEAPLNMGKLKGNPGENPFRVVLPPDRRPQWMLSFTTLPLETLKEIRRKCDVRLTSVTFAILTGALRNFLLETKGKKEEDIPENISAANTLPWPRHPARNPRTSNTDKMCNHWVVGTFPVLLKESDPVQRIKAIDQSLNEFLSLGMDRFVKQVMTRFMWTTHPAIVAKMMGADPGFGVGLTSIVGGDNYKLLNHDIIKIHPYIAMHDGGAYIPLSCFTFSHSGKLELTMGAHPSVFKDQDTLDNLCHKLCHNELEATVKAVLRS